MSALCCPLATTTVLLGFLLPWHGVSLHGCSSKAQPLFLTLDEGYLLTATVPDLQRVIAPLGPPVPAQPPLQTPSSNNTREDSTHGHHQMVNTEIRLIIFFAAKDGEVLYSQQKQDQELTVAQIMNSLLPNSDSN